MERTDDDYFTGAAQWPRGHSFLTAWRMEMEFEVRPAHLRVESTLASLSIEVACDDIKRRGANLAGLRFSLAGSDGATGQQPVGHAEDAVEGFVVELAGMRAGSSSSAHPVRAGSGEPGSSQMRVVSGESL
ncbi:hypothetical protein [Streptomyces sp. NPDC046985]|uniref:hypothetical protein n=1 Tax=Streptomyces sp. NPDC046985 TaxID=3155377 RepID=UPI0034074646